MTSIYFRVRTGKAQQSYRTVQRPQYRVSRGVEISTHYNVVDRCVIQECQNIVFNLLENTKTHLSTQWEFTDEVKRKQTKYAKCAIDKICMKFSIEKSGKNILNYLK